MIPPKLNCGCWSCLGCEHSSVRTSPTAAAAPAEQASTSAVVHPQPNTTTALYCSRLFVGLVLPPPSYPVVHSLCPDMIVPALGGTTWPIPANNLFINPTNLRPLCESPSLLIPHPVLAIVITHRSWTGFLLADAAAAAKVLW